MKLISFNNGSDMLALQAMFYVFCRNAVFSGGFFRLDLSMRVSILSEEIGLKSNG